MAKESSSSTRIPRLDGGSRIPLPGSLRPAAIFGGGRPSQIRRPTKAIFAQQQRPGPLSGLRPPVLATSAAIKRSCSGERLSNAVSMASKKTTAALKKFIGGKAERPALMQEPAEKISAKASLMASTPRPQLTRSETFIRSDSQEDMLDITHNVLAQSTPAPNACGGTTMTFTTKACETTQFLGGANTRHALYTTRSLEAGALGDTITMEGIEKSWQRSMNADYARSSVGSFGNTTDLSPVIGGEKPSLGSTITLNMHGKTFDSPNLTRTFNATQVLGKTLYMNSPTELGKKLTLNAPAQRNGGQVPDLASPISNATYSNPCSTENLLMLDDVSVPSGFDADETLQQTSTEFGKTQHNIYPSGQLGDNANETLRAPAPDKAKMKLALNSTIINSERLLDLSSNVISPDRYMQLVNLSKEFLMETPPPNKNSTQLLYMTQISSSATTTPDRIQKFGKSSAIHPYQHTPRPTHLLSPLLLLKGAQSELVLPTRTPDDDDLLMGGESIDVDTTLMLASIGARTEEFFGQQKQQQPPGCAAVSLQDVNDPNEKQKSRFSFGLDLTESTLDCSIELVDVSLSSTALSQPNSSAMVGNSEAHSPSSQHLSTQVLKKQNSFELDESLGILTPDQMKEFLDSTTTNNTNNLEMPLVLNVTGNAHKISLHQMRIDQTPSPEELPLDPVEVKTDISDTVLAQQQQQHAAFSAAHQRQYMQQQQHQLQSSSTCTEPVSQHTDTEVSKADQMTKSNVSSVSKISTSFITSVTSVTSLDTGYQGDGEMSRPASRGACDHSPSNGPAARKGGGHVSRQPSFNQQQQLQQQHQLPPIRRQDPMTDSDFFTESDADDIFHRGDRRAQVIDGQLYGPMLQPSTSVFISEDPQMEDSCMESSGIFTDVENRCDEDLARMRREDTQDAVDMSPDGDVEGDDSTETVKSNRANGRSDLTGAIVVGAATSGGEASNATATTLNGGQLSSSQTSSTIQSSLSTDRLSPFSNRTSYCSVDGSAVNIDGSVVNIAECLTAGETSSLASTKPTTKSASVFANDHCQPQPSKQRVASPRKHASLSSLCNSNSKSGAGGGGAINKKSGTSSPVLHNHVAHAATTRTESKLSVNSESAKSAGSKVSGCAGPGPKGAKSSLTAAGSGSGVALPARKTQLSNKWDAVMNKIASNKPLMKKNFSDVKSKVSTTRVSGAAAAGGTPTATSSTSVSPTVRRSPSSVSGRVGAVAGAQVRPASPRVTKVSSVAGLTVASCSPPPNGLQSPQTKRLLQNAAAKRGRSYSKDSQKSSQSDLSLTSGSPKLLAKTPLRAAKKRDVRNLSISPTDLGPPPKTQQTVSGSTARPKPAVLAITQKRFNGTTTTQSASGPPSAASTAASTPTGNGGSVKSSAPVRKHTVITKRFDAKPPTASPVREHNRSAGSQQSTAVAGAAVAAVPPTASTAKHGSKPEAATELHAIANGGVHHVNNNNISSATGTTTPNTRTSSQTPSPVLGHHGKKATNPPTAALLDKKSQSKSQPSRKSLFHRQHNTQTQRAAGDAAETRPLADVLDLQQAKLLNRYSCNGRLDYTSLERDLQLAEREKAHQDKGIEALGVLVQYLIEDLDAFACPAFKRQSTNAKESLSKTLQLLDEAKSACTDLQDQLCEKEAYYTQREEELQALHRCEMEKAKVNFADFQVLATHKISDLEMKLGTKDAANKRTLDSYQFEMDNKLGQKEAQLAMAEEQARAYRERIQMLECTEQELNAKISISESSHSTHLQAAAEQEKVLNERIKVLTREMEKLREIKEHRERELRDKLNLSQDEISVLRTSRRSATDSMERGSSLRNTSSMSAVSMEINRLQSEAESLRCVLELKQKEISKLTKHNEELMRDAGERAALQAKISLLESRNEMLQSELEIKSEKEKELLRQIDDIQKAHSHETVKRTRLSYDNEALQWHLKQRSEQLHLVEAKLQELSANDSNNSTHHSSLGSINRCSFQNGSSQMEEISPPTSPIVKAVIEKPDSVSWVLEMDDETPEAAASKMVKRAGSFRSVERSPSMRRQLSVSATVTYNTSQSANGSPGPNPLSQSMSATSVIRQHSSEAVPEFTNRSHSRIRSKSVSIKSTETLAAAAVLSHTKSNKKLMCQSSVGHTRKHELAPPTWKDSSFSCSSPYSGMRPRTSTMCVEDACGEAEDEVLFCHSASPASRKLITCDTSALNKGERLEMRSLPTHPSVHDLKVLKKCHEIQESAGEAMVSGTNSEDEGCSASSDEIASSTSTTSSATSGSTSSLNQMKNSHMSLEEVLQIEKIHSLNGTPMEMSWSDDADIFTNNTSTV